MISSSVGSSETRRIRLGRIVVEHTIGRRSSDRETGSCVHGIRAHGDNRGAIVKNRHHQPDANSRLARPTRQKVAAGATVARQSPGKLLSTSDRMPPGEALRDRETASSVGRNHSHVSTLNSDRLTAPHPSCDQVTEDLECYGGLLRSRTFRANRSFQVLTPCVPISPDERKYRKIASIRTGGRAGHGHRAVHQIDPFTDN